MQHSLSLCMHGTAACQRMDLVALAQSYLRAHKCLRQPPLNAINCQLRISPTPGQGDGLRRRKVSQATVHWTCQSMWHM